MGKKNKKAAVKKKNEKKNKERAALARKEVVEQKKTAQATGSEIKKTPQKPKTAADDKKDKQRAKQEKAKEKQRLKEKKEKEKHEANQKKKQEKIQILKDREKKAEHVKKKGKEEPTKHSSKKESKSTVPMEHKETKVQKSGKQNKTELHDKQSKNSEHKNEIAPAIIATPTAETGIEAVSAKMVLPDEEILQPFVTAEEAERTIPGLANERLISIQEMSAESEVTSVETEIIVEPVAEFTEEPKMPEEILIVGNDPCVVPEDAEPIEDIPEEPQESEEPEEPHTVGDGFSVPDEEEEPEDDTPNPIEETFAQTQEETTSVVDDPSVVPKDEPAFSIADLVRSALSKPEEISRDTGEIDETNEEINDVPDAIIETEPVRHESSDITKNPLAGLVHSALFKSEAPAEEATTEIIQPKLYDNVAASDVDQKPKQTVESTTTAAIKRKPAKAKKDIKPKKTKKSLKENFDSFKKAADLLINRVTASAKGIPAGTKRIIIAVLAGALVLVALGIMVNILTYSPPAKAVPVYMGSKESSVNVRDIEADPEQQLQKVKETNAHGNTRAFKFFANNEFKIEEWYDQFPLILGNLDTNKCDFIVTILSGDTIVYRSMGITPGKYLPSIKLFDDMPYGTYELMVVVAGYDPVTFKNIGVQHMKFKLVIGNEQGTPKETEQTEA